MQEKLRRRYQIQKEVTRGGEFQGKIEISDLARLSEFLLSDSTEIAVEFNFYQSEYDIPAVEGRIKTRLTVECQRCLKAMEIPLDMEFKLLINASDDLIADTHLDSVDCEEGKLDIFEVVEDELILELPLVTMHDDMTCNKFWPAQEESSELVTEENPFSVLAKLKTIN